MDHSICIARWLFYSIAGADRRGNAHCGALPGCPGNPDRSYPEHSRRMNRLLKFVCLFLLVTTSYGSQQQIPYRPALPNYLYVFPRDHGGHPEYKIEWWYYTGNLRSADGRQFGFE